MIVNQFIGCFIIPKLMISISLPLSLLDDSRHGTEDEKSKGDHEHNRNPVCRRPTDYGFLRHEVTFR